MNQKQITINGKICENENGFYWCLNAVFEGLDRQICIDSSKTELYFETKEETFEALMTAGKDLAQQLAEICNNVLERDVAYVVEPTLYH